MVARWLPAHLVAAWKILLRRYCSAPAAGRNTAPLDPRAATRRWAPSTRGPLVRQHELLGARLMPPPLWCHTQGPETLFHIQDLGPLAQVIAKAAEALSAGDVANRSVRQYGNWGLMPFAAAMGSVMPAAYMRGMRETFSGNSGEPNFPRRAPGAPRLAAFAKRGLHGVHAPVAIGGRQIGSRSCSVSVAQSLPGGCLVARQALAEHYTHQRQRARMPFPNPGRGRAGLARGWARTARRASSGGCWASCTRAC